MPKDTVETNYNDTGTIIMEMIYADDFLSPGGPATTAALIEMGQIDSGSNVLDIGSGLGGSAFHLAEGMHCTVQGVDLIESNVAEANRRAASRRLSERARFVTGSATSLPFADRVFDVAWGQDAWCHVQDKEGLISEAQRVLVPGGLLVFSDWLLRDPQNGLADEVRRVTASPNIGDVRMYLDLFEQLGFVSTKHADTSAEHAAEYRAVVDRLRGLEAEIRGRFGQKAFDIVLSKQEFVLDAFTEGVLGAGRFVARNT